MKVLFSFSIVFLFSISLIFAQTAAEIKYIGTYQSTDILELSMAIQKLENSFEVQFLINGEHYPGEAISVLGILSGTYDYQGNEVEFSVSNVLGQFFLTTEGYNIPLIRTLESSTDLSQFISKPAKPSLNSPQNSFSTGSASKLETEATRQFKQAIQGKRLLYLYTANGGSDKKFFDFCSDGTFYYYSYYSYLSGEFSQSINDEDYGTWEVGTIGNDVGIILNTQKGEYIEIVITAGSEQNEVLGNGRRYFVTTNETCY